MIKKYTNNSWEEYGYEKLETVDSVGGYRMGFNGSGEPLDDYTIKGGVFQTKNLCTLMLEGVFINTTNGTETTNASYKSSQFIPVDFDNIPEYVINAQTLTWCHISAYDATRKYCGRTNENRPIGTIIKSDSFTYGTPASTEPVKYIRICCNKSSVDVKFSEAVTPNNIIPVQGTGDEVKITIDQPLRAVDSENYDTIDLATKTYTKRITDEIILTGDENWEIAGVYSLTFYFVRGPYRRASTACVGTLDSVITYNGDYLYYGSYVVQLKFHNGNTSYTVDDLKAYLKEKYLSGNPIKVWYRVSDNDVKTQTLSSIPDGLTGVIEGTVTQSGTPTPDNPIDPVFNGTLLPNGKYQVYKTYKIPISSAGQTKNIYLGQVPTTRKIKKLVLTGEENFYKYPYEPQWAWRITINAMPVVHYNNLTSLSNSYLGVGARNFSNVKEAPDKSVFTRLNGDNLFIMDMRFAEVADFKSYLAEQYANGTPVIVWYVLAEPEVGIFNEPLMQIGEYADSITYEQANVPIPTSKGDTSLVVATHVPPSEVTISSSGWHLHKNAKKYHDGKWEATSWEGFRDMVIDGTAPQVYPLGTILYDDWGNTNSTGFQIVGYDVDEYMDPDMTAQGYTHNCVLLEEKLNYSMMYDMSGAWLYLEKPLPAGSYRFGYGDKIWIFTSTANVPQFGQLAMTRTNDTTPKNIQGYGFVGSETALFDVIATEWDESTPCVDLGKVVNSTTDSDISPYGKLNHQQAVIGGSNTYYSSMVRQWLIAESPKGQWWVPMTIFSRPYASYTTNTDGCLYRLNAHFKNVLATPAITYCTNTLFVSTSVNGENLECGTSYIVRDKLFLLHQYNVSGNRDSILEYYINADNTKRQKYNASGNAGYWRLRDESSRAVIMNTVSIYTAGFPGGRVCNAGFGCPAACVIQGIPGSRNVVYTTSDGEVYTTSDGKPYKVYQD